MLSRPEIPGVWDIPRVEIGNFPAPHPAGCGRISAHSGTRIGLGRELRNTGEMAERLKALPC